MPTYLAWDIGIKNLAYNIVEYEYDPTKELNEHEFPIKEWGIINLVEDEQSIPENAITHIQCCMNTKSGKQCQQKAKFINPTNRTLGYCGKHSKDFIDKNKTTTLTQVKSKMKCVNHNDKTNQDCTKNGIWLDVNNPYTRYCQVHYKSIVKDIKSSDPNINIEDKYYMDAKHASKIKQFNIKELSTRLFKALQEHPSFLEVDEVIIENQPVLKNPTMKSIQMLLYSYFVMNGLMKDKIKEIRFFIAGKKLEGFQGDHKIAKDKFGHIKSEYKQTKNSAILFCKEMIKDKQQKWYKHISDQKKQDDLADAFLTNCCYIQNNYIRLKDKEVQKAKKQKEKQIKEDLKQKEKELKKQNKNKVKKSQTI